MDGNLPTVCRLQTADSEKGCAMAKGAIKKPVTDRGYGFIQTEEGEDLFF
jgi:hypothetical protein